MYVGVNVHHQNGQAERHIRLLQDLTLTQMIKGSHSVSSLGCILLCYVQTIYNEVLILSVICPGNGYERKWFEER